MSGSGSGPLVPTFVGFVQNSMDGLMLFEACLSGKLHHVPRRPHDRERASLIKSGSIFIYEENASGIKRWTDGVAWSPSRILGNFLIYRELEKPFPPGEKKRAMKRKRSSQIDDPTGRRTSEDRDGGEVVSMPPTPPSPKALQTPTGDSASQDTERELDRQLIGSLVDSYGFRPDGLVKKTMSIAINGVSHHLVSYYKVEDVKARKLARPMEDHRLANLTIRPELYLKQNFRTPVEETEHYVVDPSNMHAHPGAPGYSNMMPPSYAMRPGQYMPSYPMYNVPVSSAPMYQQGLPPAHSYQQPYPDYYQKHQYGNSTPTTASTHAPSATPYQQHPSSTNAHHIPPSQSPYPGSATSHHGTNSPAQHIGASASHHAAHANTYHASSPHQQATAGSQDGVGGMQHVNSASYDMYDRRTASAYGSTGTTYSQQGPSSYATAQGNGPRIW
ncbi:Global transcription regulator sge1-like protein [Elsinoe fawcettii]|nr:Global transcription regulator sge1-like protein [Elsinoe fawcettii]